MERPSTVARREPDVSTQLARFSPDAPAHLTAPPLQHPHPSPSLAVGTIQPGAGQKDASTMNPIHLLSQGAEEVHIYKVSGDTVEVRAGAPKEGLLQKMGDGLCRAVTGDAPLAGPPPPSPPPSFDRVQDDDRDTTELAPLPPRSFSAPTPSPTRPATLPAISTAKANHQHVPMTRQRSSASSSTSDSLPVLFRSSLPADYAPSQNSQDTARSLSSFETRNTVLTAVSAASGVSCTPITSVPASAPPSKSSHASSDGFLHPPSAGMKRPARRNTTGSATSPTPRPSRSLLNSQRHQSALGPAHHYAHDDTDVYAAHAAALGLPAPGSDDFGPLDADILKQADQIRRERLSKRRHQEQQNAEIEKLNDEKKVVVGNLIGENHVNYVLMYNMLTGIRIAVSRCGAKMRRELTDEDFIAKHKYSFDIVGNELTPSARYDFKFKDYAPWVFRELREDYFGLDPADYLVSLTNKYILSELGSPGKSGSFFYFSRDYRFIIKTIHHTEHKFLRKILKQYYNHVKQYRHTLLSRFYGLHRVKLPHGRKIHFVIMNNLFPPHKDVHETYDLKGSTVGREFPEEKLNERPGAALKDLNWINRDRRIELGPDKRAYLTEQLRLDSEFLKSINVMDYSLLIGIHNMERGNRDNMRGTMLKVYEPPVNPKIKRKPTASKGMSPEAIAMRKAMRTSAPERFEDAQNATTILDADSTNYRDQFIFYQDEGGYRATDDYNRPLDTIYYFGVIDILTPYTIIKKVEHIFKGLSADRHKISPVPPIEYGNRFLSFMREAVMRGGSGGERFKA